MKLTLFLFSIAIIISCSRETPEYYTTDHGLKYKYHDINSEGDSPEQGDYLSVYMQWKTMEDSVFYDSKNTSPSGIAVIKVGKQKHLGGIEEAFYLLQKGDSVSFYINALTFYEDYLNAEKTPSFLSDDEDVVITIRLLDIENHDEHQKRINEEKDFLELKELKDIGTLLKTWNAANDSILKVGGVYIKYLNEKFGDKIVANDLVKLNYKASFINGSIFYDTYKNGSPDEFQIGREGQMVEGLKIALLNLSYGQKATVLVPSFLGFGSKGSSGKTIPPFTPIIYNLEVGEK